MNSVSTWRKFLKSILIFCIALSVMLNAALFLRFAYTIGTPGFVGTLGSIALSFLVVIPVVLSISEILSNTSTAGRNEYWIISRSFGRSMGATIGIALYALQTISLAFYVVALTEAFEPLFHYTKSILNFNFPKQFISFPVIIGLTIMILKKKSDSNSRYFYAGIVGLLLFILFFFFGKTNYSHTSAVDLFTYNYTETKNNYFRLLPILFPAYIIVVMGIGLARDLKLSPGSIPVIGILTMLLGSIIYSFFCYKLMVPLSMFDLNDTQNDLYLMNAFSRFGNLIVPIGLVTTCILCSAISLILASRILQSLSNDKIIPIRNISRFLSKEREETNKAPNSIMATAFIGLIIVTIIQLNSLANFLSVLFLVVYGSICLITFLNYFTSNPLYRPTFRSRWYISFLGFLLSFWLSFKINAEFTIVLIVIMTLFYILNSRNKKERGRMKEMVRGALFQLSRIVLTSIQKTKNTNRKSNWRPVIVCISCFSFKGGIALKLLNWITCAYGWGTYIHLTEDFYSEASKKKSDALINKLIALSGKRSNVNINTLIVPSFTMAVTQIIQLPGIWGMDNNMVIFEFDKEHTDDIDKITEGFSLAFLVNLDRCILAFSRKPVNFNKGIHVWIRRNDFINLKQMIFISFSILGHSDWHKAEIKIYILIAEEEFTGIRNTLNRLIEMGELPITYQNVEWIKKEKNMPDKSIINIKSADAGLTMIGFEEEELKNNKEFYTGYENIGNMLFVNVVKDEVID